MAGRQRATVIREILGRMAVKNGSGLTDHALLQRFIDQADSRLGSMRFRHGHSVSSLTFLPQGKCLPASGWSGIYVWDAKTGRQRRRIGQDFQTSLRSCSLSADGKRLATTEGERTYPITEFLSEIG